MAKTISHKNNLPYFGEESLVSLSTNKKFSDLIFELLSEQKPTLNESNVFESILNISIDHGDETPSAVETIKPAKEGKTISEALSNGILQINDVHGGAIEPAMELFYKIEKESLDVKTTIESYIEKGNKIPGFGHRIYEVDPRVKLLFEIAKNKHINDKYINLATEISNKIYSLKNKLIPINIDGAIAAILCGFGWKSNLGKAVFIIARIPGLCGHYLNSFNKN